MASKLSSLIISKQIPRLVCFSSYFSSISCATHIANLPETEQIPEFESKIRFLKNKLNPDNLIQVLDSTQDLSSSLEIFKWASLQKRFHHTSDTYFRIISKLGMVGNIEEMGVLCNEMIKEKCPHSEEAFASLIDCFVKNGRLKEALRVLEIMNLGNCKPTVRICNVLMGTLLEEKRDFKSVIFAYKEMVKAGIAPNVETLNYLIEVLCEQDRIDLALNQFRRMEKKGCSPNSKTFEVIIGGLCKRNQVDEGLMVLNEMFELKCSPDLNFYNNVIPLLCRVNKPDEAVRLFRMMTESGFPRKSLIYGCLIESLCEDHRVDDAIQLLEEMIENDITPMVDVYVDIVNLFCTLGKFDVAANFLLENSDSETFPHNSLLQGFCNADRFCEANDFLENMVKRNVADPDSWSILIRGLCDKGEIQKAFEVLNRMITSSYTPDCIIYSSLICGHCKKQEYESALELFRQVCIRDWLLDSSSYAELVEGLCHVQRIEEATEVFRYMSSRGRAINSSSLDLLIDRMCLMGKLDDAIELSSLAYNSGTSCNPVTYNTILLKLYESGRTKDVIVLFSRMLIGGCGLNSETYRILMHNMCTENLTKESAHLLDQMVGDGLLPNTETLDRLLPSISCNSQLHMVMPTLHKLASKDGVLSVAMFNILINALWKEGLKEDAGKLLDRMLENGWVPDAATHSLLIGRGDAGEEADGMTEKSKHSIPQDKVSSKSKHSIPQDKVSSILALEFDET